MKVGLFFGTFNPIHVGHMILANYLAEFSQLDEVWFVITPRSPFKLKKTMLANNHRMVLANIAVENYPKLKTSGIEFDLEPPYYTVNTLAHLEEKYPDYDFSIIMGEDNLKSFHRWKNYETILEHYAVNVYPRISENEIPSEFKNHPKVHFVEAPIVEVSSSFIRKNIEAGKDVSAMLPESVWKYIDEMNFYKN